MKIVYFSDAYWPRVNGVTVSIQTFSDALRRQGHQTLIVCPEYPKERNFVASMDETGILRVPSMGAFFSKEDRISLPVIVPDLFDKIDEFAPDVVHVQTEFTIGLVGRRYGRSRGYPIVSTCHTHWEQYIEHYFPGLPPPLTRAFTRTTMRNVYRGDDIVIVPSRQIELVLRDYGVQKDFYLIPTGVDASAFVHDAAADERVRRFLLDRFPRLESGPILLFVGRVGQEKNVAFLFAVMKKVIGTWPNATLLLVGDGPYRHVLERVAAEQGIGHACVFTGYLPRNYLPSIYALADIFTFPSKSETQGLVTIESMLCGTPVVAIGEMGTAEVMAGDNGGFMVHDDVEEFSSRVLALLGDPDLYKRKSEEALDHARSWTVESMTGSLIELYDQAIKARKTISRHPLARFIRRALIRQQFAMYRGFSSLRKGVTFKKNKK